MRKKTKDSNDIVVVESGYLLTDVFTDNYEYETYFKLTNSVELTKYFPSEFEVEFEVGGKAPWLKYPQDKPEMVILVLPISKDSSSPKKRSELRQNAYLKHQGMIPKIRLEMQDEFAMRKKLLVSDKERQIIDKHVSQIRERGLRKLKKSTAKIIKNSENG